MVDYFKDGFVHKTGMDRIFAEAEQRREEAAERAFVAGPVAAKVPQSPEEFIAAVVFFGLFAGIWYYGVNVLVVEWYWAVGVGLASGVAAQKLLLGPFFFVLILAKWLLSVAVLGTILYLVLRAWAN